MIFHNPFAGVPSAGFIKLQALRKVGGPWRAPEDWSADAFKTMCLDEKDERVEELLLIASNSQADRTTETPFRFTKDEPMRLSTSNVGPPRCRRRLLQAGDEAPYRASSAARRLGSTFTRRRSPATCGSAINRRSMTRNHSAGTYDSGNMPK